MSRAHAQAGEKKLRAINMNAEATIQLAPIADENAQPQREAGPSRLPSECRLVVQQEQLRDFPQGLEC
jgi:hypothetical protein